MPSCDEKMANQKIEEYSYCYETTVINLLILMLNIENNF